MFSIFSPVFFENIPNNEEILKNILTFFEIDPIFISVVFCIYKKTVTTESGVLVSLQPRKIFIACEKSFADERIRKRRGFASIRMVRSYIPQRGMQNGKRKFNPVKKH